MNREEEAGQQLAALRAKRAGVGQKILAIDPGTTSTGIAVFKNGKVESANVIRVKGTNSKIRMPEMCRRVWKEITLHLCFGGYTKVAIEWQMIRPDDPRPNDIWAMGPVIGAALATIESGETKILLPLPVQWKGTISGDTFTKRVRDRYPEAVLMLCANGIPESEQHNGLDAVALAAWAINERLPWAI